MAHISPEEQEAERIRKERIFKEYLLSPAYQEKLMLRAKINDACKRSAKARTATWQLCERKDNTVEGIKFFVNNFCYTFSPKTEHKHLPFILFDFQEEAIEWAVDKIEGKRDGLVEKSREMGMTWLIFVAIPIYYWLFRDGQNFLVGSYKQDLVDDRTDDSIFGKMDYIISGLPKWLIPKDFNPNKHRNKLKLVNPVNNNLISGESMNPQFGRGRRKTAVLFDELGFWDYAQDAWQGCSDTTDCRIANSCVVPETLIWTKDGIKSIGETAPQNVIEKGFNKLNLKVFGKNGFVETSDYWSNGETETLKIKTLNGFKIEGTTNHPLWVKENGIEKFKELGVLNGKEEVGIRIGMNIFGNGLSLLNFKQDSGVNPKKNIINFPKKMNRDLAYIVGLMISEGCFDWGKPHTKSKGRATITIGDKCVGEWLLTQPFGMKWKTKDNIHYNLSSQNFIAFLKWLGFGHWHAKQKRIPIKMYQCEKPVLSAMLQGMFDGDGFSETGRKRLGYTSSSKRLTDEVRMMLLNYGIMSSVYYHTTPPTKKVKIECYAWNINVTADVPIFMKEIGFRIPRKQKKYKIKRKKKSYLIPVDGFVWLPIKEIESGYAETVDFHIPDGHQFFSNGMISHNTPNGYNFFALLKEDEIATLTLLWKLHPLKDEAWYEYEKKRRTDEELAQEVDISYSKSKSGRVYPEWNETNVVKGLYPYEPRLPLYVGWDFGRSDDTAIIWAQKTLEGKLRVVDTYRKSGKNIDYFIPFVTGFILGESLYNYSEEEMDIIKKHRDWNRATHFGDPAGRFHNQVSDETVISVLQRNGIRINFKDKWKEFQLRKREAKHLIMSGIELNSNLRNKHFDICMINSAYPKVKSEGVNVVRSVKPIHNAYSHFRSAYEYLALGLSELDTTRMKPVDKFKTRDYSQRKVKALGY